MIFFILTRIRIFYVLRKAKRQFPDIVRGCESQNDRVVVWVRLPNTDTLVALNSRMFLKSQTTELSDEILQTLLPTYVENRK